MPGFLIRIRNHSEGSGLTEPPRAEEVSRRLKHLREYPWSSYRSYGGYKSGRVWLETKEILQRASRVKSERPRRYREAVKECLRRGVEEDRLERFRDVIAIGSARYIEKVKVHVGGRVTGNPASGSAVGPPGRRSQEWRPEEIAKSSYKNTKIFGRTRTRLMRTVSS